MSEHIHFVTGRLAERALRNQLAALAPEVGFSYTVDVLPITVAALMTTSWVAGKIQLSQSPDRIILPGYCDGDLHVVARATGVPVERGPRDLRDLPLHFGRQRADDYGGQDIQILAEINHAPRLPLAEIRRLADQLAADGADLIDIGCDPGDDAWAGVRDCVQALRDDGHRVSIDSLNPAEIAPAVSAGAELVLSVNSTNRNAAADWGCEVVVIPDDIPTLGGLDETLGRLAAAGVAVRIDPILEPIGCGFAASLQRYLDVRRRFPDAEIMMGIGNLTELTDVDSAGVNILLLGICQELGIRSVLTTQVINWARTSVRECDLARRLVHYAVRHQVPPKHVEPQLVTLRDDRLLAIDVNELASLAGQIKDHNFRLFAGDGLIHLVSAGVHLSAADPFDLFVKLQATQPKNLDASHAFYLGYEMAKAVTALTLGKNYRQDESLDWGFLTRPETSHRGK